MNIQGFFCPLEIYDYNEVRDSVAIYTYSKEAGNKLKI